MDNNDFKQQFTQNIKTNVAQDTVTSPSVIGSPSRVPGASASKGGAIQLPWIVSGILALALVIESIVLAISLTSYFAITNEDYETLEDEDIEEIEYSDSYIYDDNDNLLGFDLSCTSGDGGSYSFSPANTFEQKSNSGSIMSSGKYQIVNNSLIQINASGTPEKVLYFDGSSVADGTVVYDCNENIDESEE